MTAAARVTLLGSQAEELQRFLDDHPDGHERAAAVLFRRLRRRAGELPDSDRYTAIAVVPFPESWITSSSPSHCRFDMRPLRELFRRCAEEHLHFGFAHNHPTGYDGFSATDEDNERTLLSALRNRNGADETLVALLWANGRWNARIRDDKESYRSRDARHLAVVGNRLKLFGYPETAEGDLTLLARQAAAFGRPFVDQLRSLRVGVVGASGTGSPTITLLARSGVSELVIVDPEKIADSNLNRVRGAAKADVGENKALVAKAFLERMGLPVKVAAFTREVDLDPAAVDALASCDVVFGCTDDAIGRELMLAASYVYVQPLIDVGLGGRVLDDPDGEPILRLHHGRVSTILPEHGDCLFCQDVINTRQINGQYALRENPDLTDAELRERYLERGGDPSPGVGPFTSAVADFGVATLYDLLRHYRRFPPELRRDCYKIDFVNMRIRSSASKADPSCAYCGRREYLHVREEARLNRPSLGTPQ